METPDFRNDPPLRAWLERLIDDKIKEAIENERDRRFRDSFALVAVRKDDPLAQGIARWLNKPLVECDVITFGDGEKKPVIKENLAGKHVYVIATVGETEDPDVSFANTCKILSTLKRTCKVSHINLVSPCLWYQAQDKTHARREPISVRDVADDLIRRGMDHILVMELHSEQIEIAFNSFDHLKVTPIFGDFLNSRFEVDPTPLVLISPDDGGVRTREDLYKNMNPACIAGQAAVHQLRARGALDEKQLIDFVGHVEGKIGVIFDDLIRSGSTLFQAAAAAKQKGATRVIACCAHFFGFDSKGKSFEQKLAESAVDELIVTNTRPDFVRRVVESPVFRARMTVLDIAPYLARAIRNYQTGGTVKEMILKVSRRSDLYYVIHQAEGVRRPR
jgi:ribose-phosphate pyrophosphokinase